MKYYSEKLQKTFDSMSELEAAEKAYNDIMAKNAVDAQTNYSNQTSKKESARAKKESKECCLSDCDCCDSCMPDGCCLSCNCDMCDCMDCSCCSCV